MDHLVFRQRGSQLGHLARAQPGLHLVPHGPVVTTRLARDIMKHDTLHVTPRDTWHVTRDTYRTLALEHECIGDELLSVRLGVAEVVGAVAVEHLLPLLDGVLGDEVGLDKDGVKTTS